MAKRDKITIQPWLLGGGAAAGKVVTGGSDAALKKSSVEAPAALWQDQSQQQGQNTKDRDVELSEKASEAFVDGIFASIRAGEIDLPKDAATEMRRRVRTLQEEVKAMSDDELRDKLVDDTNALTGGDPDATPDESNILLKYLLARDAAERITDEKEIADLEKAYKHVKGGINKRVFYRVRLGHYGAQSLNIFTGVADVPAINAGLVAMGGPVTAAVAAGGAAMEIAANGKSQNTKIAIGAGGAVLAVAALVKPAVAAPIVAGAAVARTAWLKAGTQSPMEVLSPVRRKEGSDGKKKLRLNGKFFAYGALGFGALATLGPLALKTMQNTGAAKEIAEVAKANTEKSLGEIISTRDEILKSPQKFRDAAFAAYERAKELGGKGHGTRTARTVQLYFGDHIVNKDGSKGQSNRDAFLAEFPNNGAAFDAEVADVKAKLVASGITDTSRGLLGYIEDQMKLLTLVDTKTSQADIVKLAGEKTAFIDVRTLEDRAGKLQQAAEAIGNVTAFDELMAGFASAYRGISKDPAKLQSWMHAVGAIFEDHAADISGLKKLDADKQEALLALAQQLSRLTVETDIKAMIAKLQTSGASLVQGDAKAQPQAVQQSGGERVKLQAQEAALVKRIAAEKNAAAKKKFESDLAALRSRIAALPGDTVTPAVQTVNGKVDVLAGFTVPSLSFQLKPDPKIIEQFGIKFSGGLEEVVNQDFFTRINSLIKGMSPELKKYAARGLANTTLPELNLYFTSIGGGSIQLDPADPNFDAKIRNTLIFAVVFFFFVAPLLVGTTNVVDKWNAGRIRRKKDETLETAERSIAKQLLAHMRQRERDMFAKLLAQGIEPDPAQLATSVSEEAVMDLVRKSIVREIDGGGDAYAAFAVRGGTIESAKDRTAYAARLDEIAAFVKEKKFDEVLKVLLPDQIKVEKRIEDKLRLLEINAPEARAGLVVAIQKSLTELKDPVRAEMITALRREVAEAEAFTAVLGTELAKIPTVTQTSVIYEELLRNEIARTGQLGIELARMTAGTLGTRSREALDGAIAQIDVDMQQRLVDSVQDKQLQNEWRSGSGLTIEAAANEISKFWNSIVISNNKRLQDACAQALRGMPLKGEVVLVRTHLLTGEPTLGFVSEMIDGTRQTLVFPKAIPSATLTTTEAVVLEVERWFKGGNEVPFDLQLAVDAVKQKRDAVMAEIIGMGATKVSDAEIVVPHNMLIDAANALRFKSLLELASASALQKSIVKTLGITKSQPTDIQANALRDPIANGGSAVFRGEVSEYPGTDTNATYRINLDTGKIYTQKGSRVIAEDAFFAQR